MSDLIVIGYSNLDTAQAARQKLLELHGREARVMRH